MKVGEDPFVIEYNVRMGDPETEVVFPRIKSDVVKMFADVAAGKISDELVVDSRTAMTVMLVSKGYPGTFEKGKPVTISGVQCESIVFHAGTTIDGFKIVTNGGRVIAVTSYGESIEKAIESVYQQVEKVDFENKCFRRDIGQDLIQLKIKN